ncbi:hypothetical protein ACOSQ2_017528 [Xanthoceras sorbifolium]
MDMKKISCTVLIVAASMTSVALASRDVLAPAPAPAGESSGASAAVGSLVGASLLSLFALCFHMCKNIGSIYRSGVSDYKYDHHQSLSTYCKINGPDSSLTREMNDYFSTFSPKFVFSSFSGLQA